jgi:hypothetical protein
MKELMIAMPWLALLGGLALYLKALSLGEDEVEAGRGALRRRVAWWVLALGLPSLAQAQVDLKSSVQSGNAIIMYLCGVFAAVGIVTSGVSMMAGRPTIAKWSFAGAMVSGLGFAIVKTMWTSFGLTPADVGTF